MVSKFVHLAWQADQGLINRGELFLALALLIVIVQLFEIRLVDIIDLLRVLMGELDTWIILECSIKLSYLVKSLIIIVECPLFRAWVLCDLILQIILVAI